MSKRLAHVLEAKWRSDDVNTNDGRDFSTFDLDKRILEGLAKAGYRIPSPVQLKAIPMCLTGEDVFVQGKTGTGKTLIFSILALTAVLEAEFLEVLIIAPTREGAFQIYNTINAIGSEIKDLKCECFIGGFSYIEDLPKASKCKIAIGTPGRLLHLIEDKKLNVDSVGLFIIDDFDELLNKHLKPEISDIFSVLPEKKQTVVASLTCTDEVMELTSEFLTDHFLASLNENELGLLGMVHYYQVVPVGFLPLLSYRKKLEILKRVLFRVKFTQCIIFCNSVHRVEPLCVDIQMLGLSVVSISKAKDQVDRLHAVELLKQNKCKILVSTDVSSRGLDAENVDLVINFDMPATCRVYFHRCGRAGRYGARSSSITFLLKNEVYEFNKIENDGHFNSCELPRFISKDFNCDVNPCAETNMPQDLKTDCNFQKDFLATSTEINKNSMINLEHTTPLDSVAGENVDAGSENVEVYSVPSAGEIEEETDDFEAVTTTCPIGDFEMVIPHPQTSTDQQKIFVDECESKTFEQTSCKTAFNPYKNEVIGGHTFENASSSSNLKKLPNISEIIESDDSVTISSEIESLPLNNTFESLNINSKSEARQHLKTNTRNKYNSFERIDLCSIPMPKSALKTVSDSKMSEEYALHKAFGRIHLEKEKRCSKNIEKISPVIPKNKNIKSSKKSLKLFDCCKSQSKSEKKVLFGGSTATSPEFAANHHCAECHSKYPANHMVKKKKVNKNHKVHSTHRRHLDKCNHLCQTCHFTVQRNPKPCHVTSQHCYFPNNYCLPSVIQQRDIFYEQLMFINNFSYFLSHYV